MFKRKLNIVVSCILAVFLAFFCLTSKSVLAEQNTVEYTDVLADLSKDESFDLEKYPAIGKDNSLSVIHIAESVNKELFIYVYVPSAFARNLQAEEIRLAMPEVGKDSEYKDYKLTLLNKNGVLHKYKVDGLTVKDTSVRYYDIVQITRPFDSTIDTAPSNENTASNVVFDVSQKWEIMTVNGKVTSRMLTLETVTITDKFVGFVRYYDGWHLINSLTDSHFVSFSTDKPIDTLLEAELIWKAQKYSFVGSVFSDSAKTLETKGEVVTHTEVLSAEQQGSNAGDGLFGKKYTWERITSTSDFLKEVANEEVNITKEGSNGLANTKWILRFCETTFIKENVELFLYTYEQTLISDVTILRLKFETEGETYNLGVVDNKQTGSDKPIGTVGESSLMDSLKLLLKLVVLVIGIVLVISLILPFAPWLIKIVVDVAVLVVKLLLWVVILPFKLIFGLFKAIFKKKE